MVGWDFAEDWEVVASTCNWDPFVEPLEIEEEEFGWFKKVAKWNLGIAAIYKLIGMVWRGNLVPKSQHDREKIRQTCTQFARMVAGSTQITPARFITRATHRRSEHEPLMDRLEDAAEQFKFMRVLNKGKGDEAVMIDMDKFIGREMQSVSGFCARGMYVFRGRGEFENQGYVLGRIHMNYLVGALTRLSNSINYLARTRKETSYMNAMQWLEKTVLTADKASGVNAHSVAKAFHKVRTIYQMSLLQSEFTASVEGEISDFKTSMLDHIVNLNESLDHLRKDHPIQAMETIHLHKWMPPPDFDCTLIPAEVREWHGNFRHSGLDPDASAHLKDLYKRIQEERKANLLYAYKRKHGRWPPNFNPAGNTFTRTELSAWDMRGCIVYSQLGKDIVSQVKDKTTVSGSMSRELDMMTQNNEKSYLLWYMANAGKVDTVAALKQLKRGAVPEDNYVRVAYKPESHKPKSRLFYMAPPIQRTLLGEFEGNLANLARYYPGSLMGKDTADKERLCARVMDMHTDVDALPAMAEVTNYIITFDLEKFSPKSSPRVTEEYHAFWAEVHGNPDLASLYNIGCNSTIIHTTCGVRFAYLNRGVDLEGFRGKLMSMFHADLLSTACRIARERGIIAGKSDLVVFIDDGAVKIAAVGSGDVARANAAAFLEIMKEVYEAAGQSNHPSKTVVSMTGGEILAQFYYKGLKVPQGLKAMMRLMPDYESAASTMAEEVDQLYATTQGGVKDGADWVAAYMMMAEAIVKNVQRWVRKDMILVTPDALALKLMTPKSFGGLGISSLQGLVTNAAVNATIEGTSMLNRLVRRHPSMPQGYIAY